MLAVVGAAPYAALDAAEVEDVRLRWDAGDGDGAATDEWADVAPGEFARQLRERRGCGGLAAHRHSQKSCSDDDRKKTFHALRTFWPGKAFPAGIAFCGRRCSRRGPRDEFSPSDNRPARTARRRVRG